MSKTVRQSNMELLRIVAMLLVLVVHVDFFSIGWPDKNDAISHPVSTFFRIEFESLAIVCVNVFVLISGYFGIRLKFKSIFNFLFQILFFRIIIYFIIVLLENKSISITELIYLIVPGYNDWFVQSYLMLLLLSPILNSFTENSNLNKQIIVLVAFYGIQSVFGWFEPFWVTIFHNGYSVISFIGLYLLGRLIYNCHTKITCLNYRKYTYLILYLLISSIVAVIVFISLRLIDIDAIKIRILPLMVTYSSPIVVFCSVCLFVCFMKIKIQSKLVNWIGASVFAVYLVHLHPNVVNYFKQTAKCIWQTYSGLDYVLIIIAFIVSIFVGSIIIDNVRIFIWKRLILRFVSKFGDKISQYKSH